LQGLSSFAKNEFVMFSRDADVHISLVDTNTKHQQHFTLHKDDRNFCVKSTVHVKLPFITRKQHVIPTRAADIIISEIHHIYKQNLKILAYTVELAGTTFKLGIAYARYLAWLIFYFNHLRLVVLKIHGVRVHVALAFKQYGQDLNPLSGIISGPILLLVRVLAFRF